MAAREISDDAMVTVAALVSRVEALVVASMLQAAGILVHVGGSAHASVANNSLALGGHRLWVPASQYVDASRILVEVLGEEEWGFSYGLQRAVIRVTAAWASISVIVFAAGLWFGVVMWWQLATLPLSALGLPVNPQGRGDFYLADEAFGADR